MIATNTGFDVGSGAPIDGRLVLTKAQMLAMNDAIMPEAYFCLCSEDNALYTYSRSNTVDPTIGRFRKQVNGSGGISATTQKDSSTSSGDEDFVMVFTPLS